MGMGTKVLTRFFDCEEKVIMTKAEELFKILTHLRYEGKISQGRNVKSAIAALGSLRGMIQKHRNLQEKVIFPFLVTHIPKHETVIQFLRADHEEMHKSRLKLETALRRLTAKKIGVGLQDKSSQDVGIYFICLLRHHMDLENKCVHQAIRSELRKDEQLEVKSRVDHWLAQYHGVTVKKKRLKRAVASRNNFRASVKQ